MYCSISKLKFNIFFFLIHQYVRISRLHNNKCMPNLIQRMNKIIKAYNFCVRCLFGTRARYIVVDWNI